MSDSITISNAKGQSVETDLETIMSLDTDELPGMPDRTDLVEVTMTGKDNWFNFKNPRVGQTVMIVAMAHVVSEGRKVIKEGSEEEDVIQFVKLKTTFIDAQEDGKTYRSIQPT